MNTNDFVILPGSKAGTSVRLKTKTVKELQLEKAQLETENKEMEKRLRQLQLNMSREKEERRKFGAYHWKSGTPQGRAVEQNNENRMKVSLEKVKLKVLKNQIQEPVKKPAKPERGGGVAHEKLGVKGMACGAPEIKDGLLEPASEPTCASLGKQEKGLLLSGAFDEEASAKSFQEALLQWRKGNSDPGGDPSASGAPPESVGICEVQTNVTALKEPIRVEFQKDGLSYMEKLLLKKYRRTPVDQFFASCMKDSRPVQALSVDQAGAGAGGEGDEDDIEELTAEEVKKYWASVYRGEESNTVSENAESSLKIEFLDDSHSKDLEEPSVEETGAVGVKKQGRSDPVECGSNPVSPKEISQEKLIACSNPEINSVQEESMEPKVGRRSLSSCGFPEIPDPTEGTSKNLSGSELKSSRDLLEKEGQKSRREPQELGSACSSQTLVLPVIPKSSTLQDVTQRQKCSASYQGLEGFFAVGTNPKEEKLLAPPSLAAASSPRDSRVPFPGVGQWVCERSLPVHAEDSVVQGVLKHQLSRAANASQAQNPPPLAAGLPWPAVSIPRNAALHYFSHHEEPGPGNCSSSTCGDGTSSSKAWEEIFGNEDFQSTLELKDPNTFDIFGDWEESQMDDEEAILEDKQQVLALQ